MMNNENIMAQGWECFLFGLFLGMVLSFTIDYFGYVKKVKALKEDIQSREVEINYYKNEILKLKSDNKLLESKLDLEKAKNKLLDELTDNLEKERKILEEAKNSND